MKKTLLVLIILLTLVYVPLHFVKAEVVFSNMEISNLVNGRASLHWSTNVNSRAEIYYGLDANNLNYFMGYSLYDRWHEASLTGLERNKTYYYKIKAIEENGEISESFLNVFSTNGMTDTVRPEFTDAKTLQITDTAVVLSWQSNELTKAKIYYGLEDHLDKSTNYDSYKNKHIKSIYGLSPDSRYYFKIRAIDKDGNYREKTITANTASSAGYSHNLIISNIQPSSADDDLITTTKAIIKWDSNLISKGMVYYGSKTNKLDGRVYSDNYYSNHHQVQISGLIPNKIYYYKIKSYDSLYNKSKKSGLMSFKTKALEKTYPIGTLVKGSGPKVYVLRENMEKIWIKNEDTFNKLNYRWNMIKNVSDEYLSIYKTTINLDTAERHPTGTLIKYSDSPTVYMMYYGKKRPFYTARALERRGYSWDDIIVLPPGKKYPTGDFVF